MISIDEAYNRIANQLGKVAKEISSDYKVIICSERIFADDYYKQEADYLEAQRVGVSDLAGDIPEQSPFRNTVFAVIKIGRGQTNFAVHNASVSIEALSEENAIDFARLLLEKFVAEYNFEFRDGIVQSYYSPSVISSQEQVYTGFRALIGISGNVRIPEEGLCFDQDIAIDLGDGKGFFRLPFIDESENYVAQADPIAFSGYGGRTMNLNRQSTSTVTIATYLWHCGDNSQVDNFSMAIMQAKNGLNRKFRIVIRTNIEDDGAEEILGEKRLASCDMWATLTGFNHSQSWGEITTYALSFTESKEKES